MISEHRVPRLVGIRFGLKFKVQGFVRIPSKPNFNYFWNIHVWDPSI